MLIACTAFSIKINSIKFKLIREKNPMVAILIGRWQLSTNEGITRKHYWSNKNSS